MYFHFQFHKRAIFMKISITASALLDLGTSLFELLNSNFIFYFFFFYFYMKTFIPVGLLLSNKSQGAGHDYFPIITTNVTLQFNLSFKLTYKRTIILKLSITQHYWIWDILALNSYIFNFFFYSNLFISHFVSKIFLGKFKTKSTK